MSMSHNDDGLPRRLRLLYNRARGLILHIVLLLFADVLAVPGHLSEWLEDLRRRPGVALQTARQWASKSTTYLPNLLVIYWIYTLSWGEIAAFSKSVKSCDWIQWEHWPAGATPHHLVFVADPQLVDPHTYPGRPWPLSTLTVKHTDLYLRRAYSRIQQDLDPSTILFLGDLFDGGREWSTPSSESPEEQYRQYGNLFWQNEFDRFSSIFLREWNLDRAGINNALGERRVIASLPGNHDLGFGKGIQKPVRDRFQAFFGDGNRVDIIGNHTFVSIDSVSLSAKEQPESESEQMKAIWQPADGFVLGISDSIEEALRTHMGKPKPAMKRLQHIHKVEEIVDPAMLAAEIEYRQRKQEEWEAEQKKQQEELDEMKQQKQKRDPGPSRPVPATQQLNCVNKCWANSKYVSSCAVADDHCLCDDADFQNALYQCLYSQCQTGDFNEALHQALTRCEDVALSQGSVTRDRALKRAISPSLPQYPTVLLTHVPLYRAPGTPCGPLRERHPPTAPPPGQTSPVFPDDRNAISVTAGYQYQNVISEPLTEYIIKHLTSGGGDATGDLRYAFSGDDHDYCEVVHPYPSVSSHGVKEITVKSMSWAMGVRRPGFVLASLWNPVDEQGQMIRHTGGGKSGDADAHFNTMQTHLCLLPDQLSIFIQYALVLGVCLVLLLGRAVLAVLLASRASSSSPPKHTGPTISWIPTYHTFSAASPSFSFSFSFSRNPRQRSTSTSSSSTFDHEKRSPLDAPPFLSYADRDSDANGRMTTSSSSSTARTSPARSRAGGTAPIPLVLPSYAYGSGSGSGSGKEHSRYADSDAEAGGGYAYGEGEGDVRGARRAERGGIGKARMVVVEWAWGLWYVARVVLPWYFWLLRY